MAFTECNIRHGTTNVADRSLVYCIMLVLYIPFLIYLIYSLIKLNKINIKKEENKINIFIFYCILIFIILTRLLSFEPYLEVYFVNRSEK